MTRPDESAVTRAGTTDCCLTFVPTEDALKQIVAISVALVAGVILLAILCWPGSESPDTDPDRNPSLGTLRDERRKLDSIVWQDEVLAQEYEQPVVRLWDALRESRKKLKVLGEFSFERLLLGEPSGARSHDLGITSTEYGGRWPPPFAFRVAGIAGAGEVGGIPHCPKRMAPLAFCSRSAGTFNDRDGAARGECAGTEVVRRQGKSESRMGTSRVHNGDTASKNRRRPQPQHSGAVRRCRLQRSEERARWDTVRRSTPVLAYDLNGDGLSDLILPNTNQVMWNRGQFRFETERLVTSAQLQGVPAALLADFTGDGRADLVCAQYPTLQLYRADEQGKFSRAPTPIRVKGQLGNPSVFSAGDIDGDGDLDLWMAQYKPPYIKGQMPHTLL